MAGPTDYEAIAARYAAGIDARPWNALYERPATLALLPPVEGKDVLDAGCGNGWYSEHLADRGARVTGIDLSPRMVELARQRLAGRGAFMCADVADPTLPEASFDVVVSSLVIHYVADLKRMFAAWAQVLRPGGIVVLSTHHPIREGYAEYMRTALVEDEWKWVGARVRYYQRPLSAITEPLAAAGFAIERITEPSPSAALRAVDPAGYDRLAKLPAFLFVRARRG